MTIAEVKAHEEKISAQLHEAKALLEEFEAHARKNKAQAEIEKITGLKAKKQEIEKKLRARGQHAGEAKPDAAFFGARISGSGEAKNLVGRNRNSAKEQVKHELSGFGKHKQAAFACIKHPGLPDQRPPAGDQAYRPWGFGLLRWDGFSAGVLHFVLSRTENKYQGGSDERVRAKTRLNQGWMNSTRGFGR
jgi:hypothetical protein